MGSRTERGGRVSRVSTEAEYDGKALARVGDVITYEDGSEATIIDGAGFAAIWGNKPMALVGSQLSNGDTITESMQDGWGIVVRDDSPITGLFDRDHTVPESLTDAGGNNA
nr:PAAR domain-containing protein [Paraburkholderia sp. BL8N3]